MIFLYYAVTLLACALTIFFLFGKKENNICKKFSNTQIVALIYGVFFFIRMFGGTPALQKTLGLNLYSPFGPQGANLVILSCLLIWVIYAVQLACVTFPFFEKYAPLVSPIIRYGAIVTYGASIAALPILNRAFNGDGANELHYRLVAFAIELGIGLGLAIFQTANIKPIKFSIKQKIKIALMFIGMMVMSIPYWVPEVIFGTGNDSIVVQNFTVYHRLFLYGTVLFAVFVHFLFNKCEYELKRYALIYLSMATMIAYCYRYDFSTFTNIISWPLHLCNTAMFIVPLVLIFRMERLYYFTIFINVLGAILAMLMPNTDTGVWLADMSIRFWSNHYMATLMPILVMSLGIFKRPKIKQFWYSLLAFCGYYVLVLFLNAWFTNYDASVDFFFINSDFVAEKLGQWAEDLRKITATIHIKDLKLVFYPVYQTIYFSVYIALSFAMWFIYEQAFEIFDTYKIITERKRKIKADRLALEVHLAGRSMQEPMNPQNEGKLILRDFSKRYSTSDVYAVYKANLDIEGGQIFGFLGPNGAGKSSIIKTVVGIQTITSGEIEVSGYDADKQPVEAKMQIGYVPDHYALYENLTGREYINYIADLYNVSKEDRDARINDYVERFRLEGAIDNPIKTYSHGMKQKITIMSALVHNPKIWILDEPLTGLDPESIFQVKECMKEHASRGNIVFFSSHLIDVVENVCDRIAIIRKGQILCCKTVAEIKESGVPLETFYMNTIDGNTQEPVSVKDAESQEALNEATV